jgi:phage gpG-like protein
MITGRITGDQAVLLRLTSMNIRVREALRATTRRTGLDLLRYVKDEKLSGQVLKNRTGTLRRKINFVLSETPNGITGTVGVKLSYAAAHEYGFDGTESVRAHIRRVTSADTRAWVMKSYNDVGRRKVSEGIGYVRAHERHMRLPERSYLRSALADKANEIRQSFEASVAKAIR